jgi:hypothetical protein
MTASKDQTSLTLCRLLRACQLAEQRFRQAAEKVTDMSAKRLLTLYSHQRTRFALELRQEFGAAAEKEFLEEQGFQDEWDESKCNENIFQVCAESDQKSLEVYERALREPIPRKAHFLIAAQYALMQQVYTRIRNLSATYKPEKQPATMQFERSFV